MDTTLSVGSFISFGWETFKKRPWFFIGATIIYSILAWCASFVSGFVGAFFGSGVAGLVSFVASFSLNTLIGIGWLALFIKAHDDTAFAALSAFWHPQKFWSYLGVTVLSGIIIVGGFILFIIPGFMALTAFLFAPYFVVDKGMSPIEALKASARITKGNRLRVLGLVAATGLISLLGFVALIVGLFVAAPLVAIAYVHAYRRLSAAADVHQTHQPLTGGEIVLVIVGAIVPLLLIVIGILASIVLATLSGVREKAAAARTEANLKFLQLDLELYYDAHGGIYPATLPESIQGIDPQYQATAAAIPLDQFTYTPGRNNSAYQLCAKNPVPAGQQQCESSGGTTQVSGQ
ncbi:MAG: hypothetical protein UY67_C0035G0008 [Candidatus Kaiserbacteria bacterium GW2011_GWA2_52_12]|uniref:DUF7847 domain-containing protein n=1 Tax=Candidatus Kaiserbacteria bacterium GW2011_GWA2_52_12 TaxID=1618671 RepID=A0A0G1WVA8_9BACT|nr:MAG: hypothetical protein UY67_C0035G0008 [Candidatus Kaiserbacteria bacterium GW2011_GWA2_52_12]